MLTINELKYKLQFTHNIRRILESFKLIAAMNMKKYTMQYKHASVLSMNIGMSEIQKILDPRLVVSLNIVLSAQSGLCGNFLIDLNRLLIDLISNKKLTPREYQNELYESIEHDYDSQTTSVYQGNQDMLQENTQFNHAHVADKNANDVWIVIGNQIPDALKNIGLYHHMYIEKELTCELIKLSHAVAELENKIGWISLIGWSLEGSTPEIKQIALDISEQKTYSSIFEIESSECINDELLIYNDERYNQFMLQFIAYMHVRIFSSLAREDKIRFFTMDQAINNADEIAQQLTNDVNQTRQNLITNELIEIITGAEYAS